MCYFPNEESLITFQTDVNLWVSSILLLDPKNFPICIQPDKLLTDRPLTPTSFELRSPFEDWHSVGKCQWRDWGLLLVGWKEMMLLREGLLVTLYWTAEMDLPPASAGASSSTDGQFAHAKTRRYPEKQ